MSFHVLAKFILKYAEILQHLEDFVPQKPTGVPPLEPAVPQTP